MKPYASVLVLALLPLLVTACGVSLQDGQQEEVTAYLSIVRAPEFVGTKTDNIFTAVTADMDKRAGEEILFQSGRDKVRKVGLKWGPINQPRTLAVTECDFGKNECTITLNSSHASILIDQMMEGSPEWERAYRYLSTTIRHEIGHAFGLNHHADTSNIMHAIVGEENTPASSAYVDSTYDAILTSFAKDLNQARTSQSKLSYTLPASEMPEGEGEHCGGTRIIKELPVHSSTVPSASGDAKDSG